MQGMLLCDTAGAQQGGGQWVWKRSWCPGWKGPRGHEGRTDSVGGAVPKPDYIGARAGSDEWHSPPSRLKHLSAELSQGQQGGRGGLRSGRGHASLGYSPQDMVTK